ncbi:hypothetical protein KR074_005147 [Drosophila pseudoananassae]|nr:hypothetical protein KR074_005147 [Drosophila pseudoananassae]
MGHRNICCDGCQRRDFRGRRFRCMRCLNFDLCGDCYDSHVETLEHRVEHPMQLILEPGQQPQAEQLLGGADLLEQLHLSNCYTCPYCGLFGHTAKKLIEHVWGQHRLADGYVVCPMCAGLPAIDLVAIRNLSRHLVLNHIEHANMLEPDTPPLRRFLARSSQRSRRRRQLMLQQQQQYPHQQQSQLQNLPQPQPQPLQQGLSQPPRRQSRGSPPVLGYDILMQMDEVPPESWTPEPLLPSSIEISDDEARTRSSGLSRSGADSQVPVEDPTSQIVVLEPADTTSHTERFHLLKWMAHQEQLCQNSEVACHRRLTHALFTEQLILSMLSGAELEPPQRESGGGGWHREEQCIGLSKAMSLMSLPWTRAWRASQKTGCLEVGAGQRTRPADWVCCKRRVGGQYQQEEAID